MDAKTMSIRLYPVDRERLNAVRDQLMRDEGRRVSLNVAVMRSIEHLFAAQQRRSAKSGPFG